MNHEQGFLVVTGKTKTDRMPGSVAHQGQIIPDLLAHDPAMLQSKTINEPHTAEWHSVRPFAIEFAVAHHRYTLTHIADIESSNALAHKAVASGSPGNQLGEPGHLAAAGKLHTEMLIQKVFGTGEVTCLHGFEKMTYHLLGGRCWHIDRHE